MIITQHFPYCSDISILVAGEDLSCSDSDLDSSDSDSDDGDDDDDDGEAGYVEECCEVLFVSDEYLDDINC